MKRKEGALVQLLINYIRLTDKKKLGARTCFILNSAQFLRIMENLKAVPMSKNHHNDPVAHRRLEIWPGYMTIVNEYEYWVMLCPKVHPRIITIDTTPDTLNNVLYKDYVAVLFADAHSEAK